jgi:AdoMet-dependent rRNA methyltransferase SPB1
MPANALIIGVDLAPIKAIPRCITFQSDITTDKCRATIRGHLKTWKADTVLHDGAPNVGTAWVQDSFNQAELVLQSLKLATDFLVEGGTFVTKIFRSKDYNALLWVFNQLFTKVEATKPPSSRNVSAEIFVVCRGYKAPKRIDPKFLDPRSVFAELADPAPNNEAKVFNPEKKKRKRQGYEEGDWLQFKEIPASQFIQSPDPIDILGTYNKLSLEQQPNGDIALATLDRLPETTQEIRDCCADLKVLGRKDFKLLLRWRLKVRDIFGFASKKTAEEEKKAEEEGNVEIESMDEEMKIQEDLQRMKDGESKQKKKERRKENEKKRKDIVRMQLNMTTPMEIGMEQAGPLGEDGMFALKTVDKAGAINQVVRGKMHTVIEHKPAPDFEVDEVSDSDSDGDVLERQLDSMYEQYQDKKSSESAKFRAKRARKQYEDGEWFGFSDHSDSSGEEDVVLDDDSDDSSDEDEADPQKLVTDLELVTEGRLTRRAEMFFEQDIFKGIDGLEGLEDEDSGIEIEDESDQAAPKGVATETEIHEEVIADVQMDSGSESDDDFEIVKRTAEEDAEEDWEEGPQSERIKDGRPDIDIITAEAMTLAHQIATGQITKENMLDNGFNKYSLRDTDGLPEWFLDDEGKHSKIQRPITKAAADAIKEKLRAYNARPIKKVREAKARKKFKAAQKLEKLKKKSAMLVEDEGMSEGDKARTIAKMMARAAKKKPKRSVKVIVARGGNRGISGRPKGTKGKYKMVDARMKTDVRAQKRLKKKLGKKA